MTDMFGLPELVPSATVDGIEYCAACWVKLEPMPDTVRISVLAKHTAPQCIHYLRTRIAEIEKELADLREVAGRIRASALHAKPGSPERRWS